MYSSLMNPIFILKVLTLINRSLQNKITIFKKYKKNIHVWMHFEVNE